MKSRITKIKLTLALLFALAMPATVLAADIYVCGNGTVTLKYTGTYTLVTNDKVIWQRVDAAGDPISGAAAVEKIYSGTATDTDLVLTGGAGDLVSSGEVFYRSHVISSAATACSGDVSDAVSVFMLPAITVDLGSTSGDYCAGATPTTVTATTNAGSLPTGFTVTLTWGAIAGGAVNGTDNTKFDMTAATAGSHTVSVTASYNNTSGKALKSGSTSCDATATKSITVAPKPAKPVITVS